MYDYDYYADYACYKSYANYADCTYADCTYYADCANFSDRDWCCEFLKKTLQTLAWSYL